MGPPAFVALVSLAERSAGVGRSRSCRARAADEKSYSRVGYSLIQFLLGLQLESRVGTGTEWSPELTKLTYSLAFGCKRIHRLLDMAALRDEQFVLTRANSIMKSSLWRHNRLAVISSQQEYKALMVGENLAEEFVCVFNPLDCYDGVKAGIPSATTFGVYRRNLSCLASNFESKINEEEISCLQTTLQPGSSLLLAGYCTYSSATVLTLCVGSKVHIFNLDDEIGEFVLTRENVRVPDKGYTYTFEESLMPTWSDNLQQHILKLREQEGPFGESYESRFIGSFVADAHRILLHGGVLGVPGDIFDCPKGSKLLVYECSPLAYIFKCAGGDSTDGHGSVLDTIPSTLKQVSPIFLGSKQNVQELVAALNG